MSGIRRLGFCVGLKLWRRSRLEISSMLVKLLENLVYSFIWLIGMWHHFTDISRISSMSICWFNIALEDSYSNGLEARGEWMSEMLLWLWNKFVRALTISINNWLSTETSNLKIFYSISELSRSLISVGLSIVGKGCGKLHQVVLYTILLKLSKGNNMMIKSMFGI